MLVAVRAKQRVNPFALYGAKRHGRNRIAARNPDTRADVRAGLSWSRRPNLKEALCDGSFVLHAQPIVDLQTGVVVMDELLIQMLAADRKLIAPGDFLPAAQRFGVMPAIDRWVIAQAAAPAAATPGRRLAVNLAANTIAEPRLVSTITQTLAKHAISALGVDGSAISASSHPLHKERYQRTKRWPGRQRGAKVAQIELTRKLSETIWYMLARNQPFTPFVPADATSRLTA